MPTNEYGARLDRNGYAPSLLQLDGAGKYCYLCYRNGSTDPLNRHEVYGGAYRDKSKRLGLWCYLCHDACHQGPNGVHRNAERGLDLKRRTQELAMAYYNWGEEEFIKEFGRSYL